MVIMGVIGQSVCGLMCDLDDLEGGRGVGERGFGIAHSESVMFKSANSCDHTSVSEVCQ